MNSYERLKALLEHRKPDRIPVVAPCGTYTVDFMKKYDALWPDAHFDPNKMARLASGPAVECGIDNISVPFDQVIEGETLGATIDYHPGKLLWPSCKKGANPKGPEELAKLVPKDPRTQGRVPIVMEAIKILKEGYEGEIPIIAFITAPFTSISSFVFETGDFLRWMRKQPEKVHGILKVVLDYYVEITKAYKEAGADIITVREPGACEDNISPRHYEEFVHPLLKELIRRVPRPRIYHICGSATNIVGAMTEAGADAVSVDERTRMAVARQEADKRYGKRRYPLIGNIPAYGVVGKGSRERIEAAVKKAIDDGTDAVGFGCDIYLETPTENLKAVVEFTKKYGA